MPLIEKLLIAAGIGRNVFQKWVFKQLALGAAVLAVLAIITSVMASMVIVMGVYGFYSELVYYKFDPHMAFLMAGALMVLITALFVGLTFRQVRRLRDLPGRLLREKIPLASEASEVLNSFLDGLQSPTG